MIITILTTMINTSGIIIIETIENIDAMIQSTCKTVNLQVACLTQN